MGCTNGLCFMEFGNVHWLQCVSVDCTPVLVSVLSWTGMVNIKLNGCTGFMFMVRYTLVLCFNTVPYLHLTHLYAKGVLSNLQLLLICENEKKRCDFTEHYYSLLSQNGNPIKSLDLFSEMIDKSKTKCSNSGYCIACMSYRL